jgi:hypothetical protein
MAVRFAILVVLLLAGCNRQAPGESDEDPGAAAPGEKPLKVEVRDLYGKYRADLAGADREFKGKLVSLHGRVKKVGRTANQDQPYVFLTTPAGEQGVNVACKFDGATNERTLGQLSGGEAITIVGRVAGKHQGAIEVRHCKIAERTRGKILD